jgi:pimeloyl-ACP methyl ester carboxylesterase
MTSVDHGTIPTLLLIHPIGVGLSSRFWDRFIQRWRSETADIELLAPDLIGCGNAPCSTAPLTPNDWAQPLLTLLKERNAGPVVVVTQGSSLPIALALIHQAPEWVSGLAAISPPGWRVLQEPFPIERSRRLWRWLFQGPIGNLFYRYARRRGFLLAFSRKNLFADADTVDEEWLETLRQGSRAMETRWAVYSFLAGFWRRDWEPQLTRLCLPLLVVFGRSATGIGRSRDWDDVDQRLATYRQKLPAAAIETIPGRNVLPYESTEACVQCLSTWLNAHGS